MLDAQRDQQFEEAEDHEEDEEYYEPYAQPAAAAARSQRQVGRKMWQQLVLCGVFLWLVACKGLADHVSGIDMSSCCKAVQQRLADHCVQHMLWCTLQPPLQNVLTHVCCPLTSSPHRAAAEQQMTMKRTWKHHS
jgi:hypothetical protein